MIDSGHTLAAEARALNTAEMEIVRRILGVPKKPGELWVPYYQRSMRLARAAIWRYLGGQLSDLCWTMHWRWAGHIARYVNHSPPKNATLWFGYATFFKNRRLFNFRMPDTRRVWRWEQPVFNFCNTPALVSEFVGIVIPDNLWYSVAQDRQLWRECEQAFVSSKSCDPGALV